MKFLKLVALIAAVLIFSTCKTGKKDVKVGFLFSDYNVPRWERERDYFIERMNEKGMEVIVDVANGDATRQHNQALDFISKGVDVLVMTVTNANTAAAIVRDAHDAGVKVIAYDGLIYNTELDYLVGFDLTKVGELQAEYVFDKIPEGNYVIFNGDRAHAAASDMNKGIMKVIGSAIKEGKINLVYNGWIENWSSTNGNYFSNKVLEFSNTNIDAFIAANDAIAAGVATELNERNPENKIVITGQDGELDACNRILNGQQSMTVYKSSKLIAYAAADLACKVALNEKIDGLETRYNGRVHVPALILNPIVVDKSNLEQTIVADGIFTMDDIINYSFKK